MVVFKSKLPVAYYLYRIVARRTRLSNRGSLWTGPIMRYNGDYNKMRYLIGGAKSFKNLRRFGVVPANWYYIYKSGITSNRS